MEDDDVEVSESLELILEENLLREKPTRETIIRAYEEMMGESDLTYFPPQERRATNRIIPLQRKMEIIAFWEPEGKKRRSFTTVQNRFKSDVKFRCDLHRYKNDVENCGTKVEKLIQIYNETYEKFLEAKKRRAIITDVDLRRWALQAASNIDLKGFKASPSWCLRFKRHYRIVSRKITKFVTKSTIRDEAEILKTAKTFIANTSDYIKVIGPRRMFNSDQSGFNREMHHGRTLALCGDTDVHALAQSINGLTHSYTVMPTLSAEGVLLPKTFLVLQEVNGVFGPNVKAKLKIPPNVEVVATKSGKMGCADVVTYMRTCFAPYCGDAATLILDQWTGFRNRDYLQALQEEFNVEIEILDLPKSCTWIAQPFDVHVFRMMKHYVKKLSDLIILLNIALTLCHRQNIINVVSFTHHQFSSPRHRSMLLKAWSKPGYIPQDENAKHHITPAQWSFGPDGNLCDKEHCCNVKLVRCTWCKQYLCHEHSLVELHLCDSYIP
ncbi:hypothetical protein B566_EDAN010453 [Ephemera danica]|nr:hypothetical protein B566_EDAN010453 [Ephemera danica]